MPPDSEEKEKMAFQERFNRIRPGPTLGKNCIWAFCVGGLICVIGQGIQTAFVAGLGLAPRDAGTAASIVLVFLSALRTGLGFYNDLGKRAGAGSIVPITGFANSVVAPALEFKREGYVFGVGARMFVIAGPVLVYGTAAAAAMGVIHWLLGRSGGL